MKVSDPFKRTVDRFLGVRGRNMKALAFATLWQSMYLFMMISFARKMISERMHLLFFGFHKSIFSEGRVNCSSWSVRSIETK